MGDCTFQYQCGWGYAFLLILVSRIWTVLAPDPHDAELFAYIGRRWIQGAIPYRELWDNKPPGIFAVNALAAFTHSQFLALALFEFIALVTTAVLISAILSELDCGPTIRWAGPIVAASILTIPYYSQGGNLTEIYLLPFASGCIYCFLRATRGVMTSRRWLVLAGLSAGFAAAFKPVGIAPLLATTVFSFASVRKNLSSRIIEVVLTWIGFFVVWICIEACFGAYGVAGELINAALVYNLHYGAAAGVPILKSLELMADRLWPIVPLLGCVTISLLLRLWPKTDRAAPNLFTPRQYAAAPLLFLWLAADLCGARAGGRYYPHYFLPVLLSMVVVGCIGIDILAAMTSHVRYSQIITCTLLVPIVIVSLKGQIDSYFMARNSSPDEWTQAAIFIRDHKAPSDTVFTWGYWPGIYRIANSYTPTRWDSAHYIKDYPGSYAWIGGELLTELRTSPPNFIVSPCSGKIEGNTARNQFMDFLANDYHLVYATGGTCVFQRS